MCAVVVIGWEGGTAVCSSWGGFFVCLTHDLRSPVRYRTQTQQSDRATGPPRTGGGVTGEYTPGNTFAGVAGSGGITLNSSSAGATGTTGGILIQMDAATTKNLPRGRFFYDLEINQQGTVTKVISGRFEVLGEISR